MSKLNEITITYRFTNTRLMRVWVRTCGVLRFLVGQKRAERWALAGVERFVKVKIVKPTFKIKPVWPRWWNPGNR